MKSCIIIGNNKGKGIGVMVLRETNNKRSLLLLEVRIRGKQHNKIQMWFVLLVVKSMEGGHVIERQELALVVGSKDT